MIFLPFFLFSLELVWGKIGRGKGIGNRGVVFGDKASKSKHTLGRQGASRIGKSYLVL